MAEYIKREDILDYAHRILPSQNDYDRCYRSEAFALDKQKEISEELETFPYEEIDVEWHDASKELPPSFVSVIGHMTDADLFPECRECYAVKDKFFFPALDEFHPVDYWIHFPMPNIDVGEDDV